LVESNPLVQSSVKAARMDRLICGFLLEAIRREHE
jgi:hypothetical protein